MHGLINRSLQCFLRDTYGDDVWREIARDAEMDVPNFEAMLSYEDDITYKVLSAAGCRLGKPCETLLEDLGTYLVSHPTITRVRRLLRFGGDDFAGFLASLEDLPGRARLAVPDLDMPYLALEDCGDGTYRLTCGAEPTGMVHVAMGMLRAMADDYGALVWLDCAVPEPVSASGSAPADPVIEIQLLSSTFAEGRQFVLSALPA